MLDDIMRMQRANNRMWKLLAGEKGREETVRDEDRLKRHTSQIQCI